MFEGLKNGSCATNLNMGLRSILTYKISSQKLCHFDAGNYFIADIKFYLITAPLDRQKFFYEKNTSPLDLTGTSLQYTNRANRGTEPDFW